MDVIRLKTPNNTQQLIFWDLKDNFVIYRVIKSLLVGSAQYCTLCHLFHRWHCWSLLYCNLLMWHVLMIDHYCSSYILEMSTLLCVCSVTCDVRRCVPGVRAQPIVSVPILPILRTGYRTSTLAVLMHTWSRGMAAFVSLVSSKTVVWSFLCSFVFVGDTINAHNRSTIFIFLN